MPRYSVCIETNYRDLPLVERIRATRDAGLDAIELGNWRDQDLEAIRAACAEHGVQVVAFALDTGGPLTVPGDIDALMTGAAESIEAAEKLGARTLLVTAGDAQPGVPREDQRNLILAKLQAAAPLLEDAGVTAVLGPLSAAGDGGASFLVSNADAARIVDEVASPNVKLLFRLDPQAAGQEDVLRSLADHLAMVGHVHAPGSPGRREPGTGSPEHAAIFRALDAAGYNGYVGLVDPAVARD